MEKNGNSHHVAWADRIGLNKTWAKAIERIWATYGTSEFSGAVWGLHVITINIKNGPQLKTEIDQYIQGLRQNKHKELESYYDTPAYNSENNILEEEMLPSLANFMIQLLEDNGFGMYKSERDRMGSGDYIEFEEDE